MASIEIDNNNNEKRLLNWTEGKKIYGILFIKQTAAVNSWNGSDHLISFIKRTNGEEDAAREHFTALTSFGRKNLMYEVNEKYCFRWSSHCIF